MKKKYYCRHCRKKFNTLYMAEICFDLDIKVLQNEKLEANQKLRQLKTK